MRNLYTLAFYLVLPFILLRARWRARKNKDHAHRLGERIGFYPGPQEQKTIWVHAVSYGEAVAAEPLVKKLREVYPTLRIIITTMTLTGATRVQMTWQKDSHIKHLFLPYDIPFAIKRFFKHINPLIGVIMETELWPNVLYIAGEKKIPILLANARLSIRSFDGYHRIKKFMMPFLKNLSQVAAQTEQDKERFLALGVPKEQAIVLGNLKFDITPPAQQIEAGLTLKQQLPFDRILIAASTHANEEEQLLDVFARLKNLFPRLLFILVPRHPQRFEEIANLCVRKGYTLVRRSENQLPQEKTDIFLGDTMGELYFFYSIADIAFVGGSLVPVGGHNLLEPAAIKLPIVTGQHLFNFSAISALLLETGTLNIAENNEALYSIFCKLLNDKDYCQKIGSAGYAILEQNRGATERHVGMIERFVRGEST